MGDLLSFAFLLLSTLPLHLELPNEYTMETSSAASSDVGETQHEQLSVNPGLLCAIKTFFQLPFTVE